MERKLATIAKIEEIRVHPNADALELARIRGWQVVIRILFNRIYKIKHEFCIFNNQFNKWKAICGSS